MRVQSVNLNLIPTGVMPIVHLSQYDRDADGALLFNIFNGPAPFNLTGCTATINGTKPDGNVYTYPCTVHSNFLTSAVYDQMTTVQGTHEAEIRISDGDSVVGTLNFQMAIEKAGVSEIDVSHTDVPTLLENIQASVDEAEYWAEQAASAVTGVSSFNGRHGSVLPIAGDYDSEKILLASALHIGGETQNNVQEALEALSDGSGHTILNGLGQEMPQRKNLRFAGANVSDDAENDTTNVTITGGSGGSTITVTTIETTLYGETVTITDGTSTFTGVFDNSGVCVIDGVTATGTLTITSGAATNQLNVPYYGNYTTFLSFWAATINVTTDPGINSAIVKKDGVQIGTVNFTSGSGTYIAGSTGAYTFEVTVGGVVFSSPTVTVTEQTTYSTTIDIFSAILNISTSASSLYGKTITIKKGSTTVGTTAFSAQGSATYTVHETGTYTCECEGYSGSATVSAETTYNVTIDSIITYHLTVDIYSAASDTLSYTDDNGAQTVTTDATGKAAGVSIDITQPSIGVDPTITFTSSVAKDPSNLSNDYYKSVTVTSSTMAIYVMPDHAYYWYGWRNSAFEPMSTSNGWTFAGAGFSFVNPTFNTTSISWTVAAGTSQYSGVGVNIEVTCKAIKAILTATAGLNGAYCLAPNKSVSSDNAEINGQLNNVTTGSKQLISFGDGVTSNTDYLKLYHVRGSANQSVNIEAIWTE